jgi:glutamyl-tRNA reductase
MQRLLMVGLNHTTAPLAVREKLAFSGEQRTSALAAFRARFADAEAVLLSTCNRVELYVARGVHGHPRAEEMVEFLAAFHCVPAPEVARHFYHKADRQAVCHLFSVTSSLDSMVLGETQILGQVRQAYDLARDASTAGSMLNPLFQRAIAVGKQVMSSTSLGEGRVSVASVAVDYARRVFDHFDDKTVLAVGAGKMTALVLEHFAAVHPGRLLVCNRDAARGARLAAEHSGAAVPFERLAESLILADIVISSTGAPHAIVTRAMFEQVIRQRRYRPVFLIDIALPRDIEAEVGQIENVYLYNIDDLQEVVSATQSQRAGAVAQAKAIVDQHVDEFAAWHRARQMGPIIERLYKRYQSMAADEVGRTVSKLGGVSPDEKEHLEELARRIVNKLLHGPIRTLRSSGSLGEADVHYLQAVEKLFGLADESEEQERGLAQEKSEQEQL